jgi:L-alanine-DL-glutamate epimerase-like enolase superfamily enzyme
VDDDCIALKGTQGPNAVADSANPPTEYDVPLLMTVPNAYGSESFDWVDDLITNPIRMEDGFAFANEEPGWGFQFRDKFLTSCSI